MNLEEIGAFLKSERTKRHLTIDDVARQIKINPRLLTALESGNEAGLPHAAYVRGFIRSYAAFLGVGKEEIQGLLDGIPRVENIKKPVGEEESLPEPPVPARQGKAGGGSFGKMLAVLLILGALAGGGWWAWQNGYFEQAKEMADAWLAKEQAPAPLDEKLPETGASLAEKDKFGAPEREAGSEARREPEPAVAPIVTPGPIRPAGIVQQRPKPEQPKPEQSGPDWTAERAAAEQGTDGRAAQGESATPEQHKLIITATEECWVHSNADKTDTRQFSLRKGDAFALTFSKTLELKLGNAGGVRLRYDGNDLPPPGTSGQVKTIVFPPKSGAGE